MIKITPILVVSIVLLFSGCNSETPSQDVGTVEQAPDSAGGNRQQQKLHEDEHVLDMPMEDVSPQEIEALNTALDDEYKAHATYAKVIEDFGQVNPFANIINAEKTHIAELLEIYAKYNLEPIEDRWLGNIGSYSSIGQACQVGVEAEIANADLYDGLFSKVDNQDITAVFTSLRDASREKHLPAFQRCASKS